MVVSRQKIWLVGVVLLAGLPGCSHNYRLAQEDVGLATVWPMHRGGASSTGQAVPGQYSGRLDVIWEEKVSGKPAGPLAIANGALVYPSTKRRIKFFGLEEGDFLGKIKCKGIPHTGMAINDSLAFYSLAPRKNQFDCINLRNGKTVWKKRLKDASGGPIIHNNRLMVGSRAGLLMALDPTTGDELWTFQTEGRLNVPATVDRDMVFQGDDLGNLYALKADSGTLLFQVKLDGPVAGVAGLHSDLAGLLVVTTIPGTVYSLALETGDVVWSSKPAGSIWAAPAVGFNALVGTTDGYLVALDLGNGDELWRYRTEEVVRAAPILVGPYVLVGTLGGSLYCFDGRSGRLVDKRQLTGAIRQSPVSDGNRVYVATESGMIICCGESNETRQQTDH